jgi:hypothetical protein
MSFSESARGLPEGGYSLIKEVNSRISRLSARRVNEMHPDSSSRTLAELQLFVQLTLHRTVDLADAAANEWQDGKPVAALILTRTILESAAVIFDLSSEVERFSNFRNDGPLRYSVALRLFGSRNISSYIIPPNVLSAIDKTNKAHKGFREVYDELSEIAHPNFQGMYALYMSDYAQTLSNSPQRSKRLIDSQFGLHQWNIQRILLAIDISLEIIEKAVDKIEGCYPQIQALTPYDAK